MKFKTTFLQQWIVFIASFATGWLLWELSPEFTGDVEPWDAASPYYTRILLGASLLISFFCSGLLFLIIPVAMMLGQIAFIELRIVQETAVIFPSFIAVPIFSLIPITSGTSVGFFVKVAWRHFTEQN